jgi:hypothetical protein
MKYKRLYIAYGSNINLEQMAHRCPTAKRVTTTAIPNYELQFQRVATISPKKGSQVPVLIWELGQKDELSLDRYEGFPNLYRKEIFDLEIDGKVRECMAYVMNYGEISPPTSQYFNGIMKGYKDNGLDTDYLIKALEQSIAYEEKQEEEMSEDDDLSLDDDLQMTFQ